MPQSNATEFDITVTFQYKPYRFHVLHEPVDKMHERFTVTIKDRVYVFHSNRPFLKFRIGLKRRRVEYRLVSGTMWNISFQELLVSALDQYTKAHLW